MTDPFWLTSAEACAYVRCKSVKGWYEWRKRHGIVKRTNGTVNRADLDRALTVRTPRRSGGSVGHPASLANLALRHAAPPEARRHV